jgi:hypothetical protein
MTLVFAHLSTFYFERRFINFGKQIIETKALALSVSRWVNSGTSPRSK